MKLIQNWDCQLKKIQLEYSEFINTNNEISKSYTERKNKTLNIGFNIFTLITDYYYRENFHSDIIKIILELENFKTLPLFIEMLNQNFKENNIKKSDFSNPQIFREKERIDILITDDYSKKAIIIENKINNAGDTERQLPKYFEKISTEYEVVAIVYLTLTLSKTPHKLDWTDEEIENINKILTIIPSISKTSINLLDNFLNPSILIVNSIDENSVVRQYSKLIKYLNHNTMDSVSLEKFRENLLIDNNLETAISIRNMLNDLPEHIAIRIEEKYNQNCFPFKNVWRYKNTTTVFEAFEFDNLYFKLDIQCSLNGYKAIFWNAKIENFNTKEKFNNLYSLKDFTQDDDRLSHIYKTFKLNEENLLFDFIDMLKNELKPYKL